MASSSFWSRPFLGLCCVALGLVPWVSWVRGDEAAKTVSISPTGLDCFEVRLEVKGSIPEWAEVPLLKYFVPSWLKSAPVAETPVVREWLPLENTETDGLPRIGVDFDVLPGYVVSFLPTAEGGEPVLSHCLMGCCPQGHCPQSHCLACAQGAAECLAGTTCSGTTTCPSDSQAIVKANAREELPAAANQGPALLGGQPDQIWERFAELIAENAALNATLEARREAERTRADLMDRLVELSVENAQLKANVELAEKIQEATQEQIELALENERLKMRLAQLESAQETQQTSQRTARKARNAQPATPELK